VVEDWDDDVRIEVLAEVELGGAGAGVRLVLRALVLGLGAELGAELPGAGVSRDGGGQGEVGLEIGFFRKV
jgi:hypothetical protein